MNESKLLNIILKNNSHHEKSYLITWDWKSQFSDFHNNNFPATETEIPDHIRYWANLPLLPVIATIVLTLIVFLLLIFQRNPSLVAGIVAGVLGAMALYLFVYNLHESRIRYE